MVMSEHEGNETVAPIVDIAILEAAKENIQPLASGRRATALAAVFSTPSHNRGQASLQYNPTHIRLRAAVETALASEPHVDEDGNEGGCEDPSDALAAYTALVHFTTDALPSAPPITLLEEATRALRDAHGGRYRKEQAYLRLWILYASFVERPSVIYAFLVANDIGTDWSALYEEYALALELEGRRPAADEIYNLGIARQAAPLGRLVAKHREFQKRMMASPSLPSAPAPTPSTSRTNNKPRAALATTSTAPAPTPAAASTPAPNGRLQIFADPDPQGGGAGPGAWPELGTVRERVKENRPEVRKAGETRIKQKRPPVAPSGIVVFKDPEPEEKGKRLEVCKDPESQPTQGMPKKVKGIDVFMDEAPAMGSSGFVPFKDSADTEAHGMGSPTFETPAQPRGGAGSAFTPFREDGASPSTPTGVRSPTLGPTTMLRAGKRDGPTGNSSVAEDMLRKDPLKFHRGEDVSRIDEE